MKNLSNITILIPTYNRPDDLNQCLSNLRKLISVDIEVIIYDDASPKIEDIRRVANSFSNITLIEGRENRGQAYGRNILLFECKTDYAVFMDDDCWFVTLGHIKTHLDNKLSVSINGTIVKYDALSAQVFRTSDMATAYPREWGMQRIYVPIGMGFVVDVERLKGIGGFNEKFGYRHEETELGMRMWSNDLKILFEPSSVVEHCHSSEAREDDKYQYLSARNLILMHYGNIRFPFGVVIGLTKAILLFIKTNYRYSNILKGIYDGINYTLENPKNDIKLSLKSYKKWSDITK